MKSVTVLQRLQDELAVIKDVKKQRKLNVVLCSLIVGDTSYSSAAFKEIRDGVSKKTKNKEYIAMSNVLSLVSTIAMSNFKKMAEGQDAGKGK